MLQTHHLLWSGLVVILAVVGPLFISVKIGAGKSKLGFFERLHLVWCPLFLFLAQIFYLWGKGPLSLLFVFLGFQGLYFDALLFWESARERRQKIQLKIFLLSLLLGLWAAREGRAQEILGILIVLSFFPLGILYFVLRKIARLMSRYFFFSLSFYLLTALFLYLSLRFEILGLPGQTLALVSLFFGNQYLGRLSQFAEAKLQFQSC